MTTSGRVAPGTEPFWSQPDGQLLQLLVSDGSAGLSPEEAASRLARLAPAPSGRGQRLLQPLLLLLRQFGSPIVLILIAAALLSFALGSPGDGAIILTIVLLSGLLGFWQERGAAVAIDTLLRSVALSVTVWRGGREWEIPAAELVPGDVVVLRAGDAIPADCRLLQGCDLFVDEALLTGESFPVGKRPGCVAAQASLGDRWNVLHGGTHVISGSGRALVVHIGADTSFGQLSARLRLRPDSSGFELGVRRFGTLLMEATLLLVLTIFAINVILSRPVLDSFLFALALAVGLTPQLLPAIISVNLAKGARGMAAKQVIVKRLAAIEDFGSMDVLCSDKTGTLTVGRMELISAQDVQGEPSGRVLFAAYLNASFESSFLNPIDAAIRSQGPLELQGWSKCDERPYDFVRKRLSVLVEHDGQAWLISKGSLANVLQICDSALLEPRHLPGCSAERPSRQPGGSGELPALGLQEFTTGERQPLAGLRSAIERQHTVLSRQGHRVIAVAIRPLGGIRSLDARAEAGMTFLGLLAFADPPKPGIARTIAGLEQLGVQLKIISGDHRLVALEVGRRVGLQQQRLLCGDELRLLSDHALPARASRTDIFAEIEPNQKERIVRALRRAGHVVGYLGDGINDTPALHAADVSISVQGAADAAKEAADIVLLNQDLAVLQEGVREGRRTFANTLKYVFMATSANFGNMMSMAAASLVLPFLPLLPKQVLLTNLLTDLPELTIASDRVDSDWIRAPRRWDVPFIRRFMVVFGLVSSAFDILTFVVLLWLMHADVALFRTGWFVESVVSAALIVLVVRTRAPFLRSRPSPLLLAATLLVVCGTVLLPFTPLAVPFGFVPLPRRFLLILGLIVAAYIATAEAAKRLFYRRLANG
ncbi:MAG: HAD-IC family P-type ATPase [Synechococcaceae cyanobacterium]|nr:HAD-IC family P-type ATPase [Synechococcaceae cyanobacterium]